MDRVTKEKSENVISRNRNQLELLELRHPWVDNSELPSARGGWTPRGPYILYVIVVYLLRSLPLKRLGWWARERESSDLKASQKVLGKDD